MKKKLNHLCYCLSILLVLTNCTDEMIKITNEQNPIQDMELFYLPDPIKAIFEYDESISIRDRSSIEHNIEQLYNNRGTKQILLSIMKLGIKVKMVKASIISEMKTESYCRPYFPPEIGFLSSNYITLEILLHELLHLYAYYHYPIYTQGGYPACEEYEVRVLTDLLLSKYFRGYNFKHQGMQRKDPLYAGYKNWLKTLIDSPNYDPASLKKNFQMYGAFCAGNLGGFNDNENNNPSTNVNDFNHYTPQLLKAFWFGL